MDLAKGQQQPSSSSSGEKHDNIMGYKLFGVIKEIGVDDTGLIEFYTNHYTFPLLKDDGLVFYNDFFGKRKVKLTTLNPVRLYKGYKDMNRRLKEKKLEGNLAGEGMVSGVLFFCY